MDVHTKSNEDRNERMTLLLVGRAGNGKSSVGNSILGKPIFKKRIPSEMTILQNEIAYNDKYVVVDCSGIGDTGADMPDDISTVKLSAFEALIIHKNNQDVSPANLEQKPTVLQRCGFDALLFVMKYGVRFTKQEKDAVQLIKDVFGKDVFRKCGILVFSYGDNFRPGLNENEISFESWCKEQCGDIKALFEEIRYRCVIFDNKTNNKDKLEKNRSELNQQLEHLKKLDKPKEDLTSQYFIEHFISTLIVDIDNRFSCLKEDANQLNAMTSSSVERKSNMFTLKLRTEIKDKLLNLKQELEAYISYFSVECENEDEESQVDAKKCEKITNGTTENEEPKNNSIQHRDQQNDNTAIKVMVNDDQQILNNSIIDQAPQTDNKNKKIKQSSAKDDKDNRHHSNILLFANHHNCPVHINRKLTLRELTNYLQLKLTLLCCNLS